MSIVALNQNICSTLVVNQETLDDFGGGGEGLMDPDATIIPYEKDEDDMEEDVLAGIEELEGDPQAVAFCRAIYDLNEIKGGFCCQSLSLDFGVEGLESYIGFLVDAGSVELVEEDPITVDFGDGFMVDMSWGAEVFASGKALAASALTMAASLMVFTQ